MRSTRVARPAPWRGPIAVVEADAARDDGEGEADLHVVNNWCLLGTVRTEAEVWELLESAPRPRFDLDLYRILTRHLRSGGARVVELGAKLH